MDNINPWPKVVIVKSQLLLNNQEFTTPKQSN